MSKQIETDAKYRYINTAVICYNHIKELKEERTGESINCFCYYALTEHLAKSFALCRRNFLFSNTPGRAEAREIAKLNKINAFEYLTYIFETSPQLDMTKKENIEKLLRRCF